ncbi:DUF3786 domain-containing protein [Desulfosarcina sp. OttesenSCG-928-G10]|nr:DUF3786 domain-containing protein [Desulfosarcina sp. OttesenSCG-928-G10]
MTHSNEETLFRWAAQLPESLWNDLRNRPAAEAAETTGAIWDGKTFSISLLGRRYRLDPSSQTLTRDDAADTPVSYQTGVVLLNTLSHSKGVPPSGRMTVPQDLPGGRMFFVGAHALGTDAIATAFSENPDQLEGRIAAMGGEKMDGADAAFRIPGLPLVPLYVLLWQKQGSDPARAVIGIDDRAHFHLDLAGIFALTNILVSRLCGFYRG